MILFLIGLGNQLLNGNASPATIGINLAPTHSAEERSSITFSLDLTVVGELPPGSVTVFFVEYRGYPNYRILRMDEGSDEVAEIIQIPKGAVVYSLAMTADKSQLLVALGLAITKSIVVAHDGEISVASTPDRGTQFNILLPII